MIRSILFFVFILSVFLCTSAQYGYKLDNYIDKFIKGFQAGRVQQLKLTCSNYNDYCTEYGIDDFGNQQACQIWSKNLLCNNATSIKAAKDTMAEIRRSARNLL